MFGTFLKHSLGVLPWLLLPVACYIAFILGVDPYYIQVYGWAERVVPNNSWGEFAQESALVSLIVSFISHISLLLIVPCAIGGVNTSIKHFQFFLGFFANIALSALLPVYFQMNYGLDTGTFVVLLVLHTITFLATYIIGSRFVAKEFRRAFWFTLA
jgi:hypothetical protein